MDNINVFPKTAQLELIGADITDKDWEAEFPDGVDVIVHCAAQVSHPRSIEIPVRDFTVNALGTLRLLEFARRFPPKVFIHIGTAKIYGQNVDKHNYEELETRYWPTAKVHGHPYYNGINESCSVDQVGIGTPFSVSKLTADKLCQEWAYTYGLQTAVLRPGVFTGQYAKPVIYQNWVGQLVKDIMTKTHVDIIGWKGKQVRDVLHTSDLVDAIMLMIDNPPPKGEVYNIGGGMDNAISLLEAFYKICKITGKNPTLGFLPKREGDWCVYVGDNSKLEKQYPEWKVTKNLDYIINEVIHQQTVVMKA